MAAKKQLVERVLQERLAKTANALADFITLVQLRETKWAERVGALEARVAELEGAQPRPIIKRVVDGGNLPDQADKPTAMAAPELPGE